MDGKEVRIVIRKFIVVEGEERREGIVKRGGWGVYTIVTGV